MWVHVNTPTPHTYKTPTGVVRLGKNPFLAQARAYARSRADSVNRVRGDNWINVCVCIIRARL